MAKQEASVTQLVGMIEKGQIYVNGQKAVLGQKVEENDEVTLSGHARKKVGNYVYYVVNKPRGIESHGVGTDSEDIISKLELAEKVLFGYKQKLYFKILS